MLTRGDLIRIHADLKSTELAIPRDSVVIDWFTPMHGIGVRI